MKLRYAFAGNTMPRANAKDNKYDNNGTNRRMHTIMSPEDKASGKKSCWTELELSGNIRHLSPQLFQMTNLTTLLLKSNNLQRLPPDINLLCNLAHLDLSHNKLRTLPAEIGELIYLRYVKSHKTSCPNHLPLLRNLTISPILQMRACMAAAVAAVKSFKANPSYSLHALSRIK